MRNKIMLLVVVMCMATGMRAQFYPGFNPAAQAKKERQKVAAEAEKNYQKGNELLKAQKLDKALVCYEKAASAGHAGAQYNMGVFYAEGKVVEQDYQKAVEWFERAAEQGMKDAEFNLASIYHQGLGGLKDPQKAEYWARKYKGLAATGEIGEVIDIPDEQPKFPGGDKALMQWLQENLHYPVQAAKEHATGRVLVNFVINTDGSTDEVKVLRSAHPLLDQEAMRVVKEMPKWEPGKKDGKVVRVRFTLPITFHLNMNNPQQGK